MRKPSENVFCSPVLVHDGIFILIACEAHLKRWYDGTVSLENTDRSAVDTVQRGPLLTRAVTEVP